MTLRPHEDAMQRDATRARGQWEGDSGSVGARGGQGDPRSPSPSGQADRADRFAQPANSYQLQKYSLAQDTPARMPDDGLLYPRDCLTPPRIIDNGTGQRGTC